MDGTQESATMSQNSTNIRDLQSKPTLRGIGLTGSHPTSPTSHHPNQPPADRRTIDHWIRDLPPKFPDVNDGVIRELTLIVLRHFNEVKLAAVNHQGAIEVLEMLEQRKWFSLWTDGDDNLDPKLSEAADVREPFVSNLTALVLLLHTGSTLLDAIEGSAAKCRDRYRALQT